jgi:hypothetical protein
MYSHGNAMSMDWLSLLLVRNLETSLPPETMDTFDIGVPSLLVRNYVGSLVTPPGMSKSEALQPKSQCLVITWRHWRWESLCGS